METLFHWVIAEVQLSFRVAIVKGTSAITDYKISKLFDIPFKVSRVVQVHHVCWAPAPLGYVKIICDGSAIGSPCNGSIDYVIRDNHSNFLGAFTQNVGYASSLDAVFLACMRALEKAKELSLHKILLESDSLEVIKASKQPEGIPWRMFARWHNCMKFCSQIDCSFSHVPREANMVADALAKNGQSLAMHTSQWWSSPPSFLSNILYRDSLGLSFTRKLWIDRVCGSTAPDIYIILAL